MSKVALSGNASGTGTFTIASPNSNVDRTLNLPDASGTVQVSGNPISGTTASFSGNVTLGSSVLATPTGSAPSYTCRAWVNFNGSGTVAIRASGNVSSITDIGVGIYITNYATAMPDENYSMVGTSEQIGGISNVAVFVKQIGAAYTTTQSRFGIYDASGTARDSDFVFVNIFR